MLPFSRNINIYYRDRAWGEEIYNEVLSKMRVVHLEKDFAVCADGTHVWLMNIRNRNAVRANVALCDEKITKEELRALVIPAISPGGTCWIARKKNWEVINFVNRSQKILQGMQDEWLAELEEENE